MSQFKKGISQQFVDRLNAEYKAGGWWKSMAGRRAPGRPGAAGCS